METATITQFATTQKNLTNVQTERTGEHHWIVEGQYNIEPSQYNDNATTKYDGYNVIRILRREFKDYIRDRLLNFIELDNVDIVLNNDCLDTRYNEPKLSVGKLVKKVWDNERFDFLNDGHFTDTRYVYIFDFNYSMFNSHFQEQLNNL